MTVSDFNIFLSLLKSNFVTIFEVDFISEILVWFPVSCDIIMSLCSVFSKSGRQKGCLSNSDTRSADDLYLFDNWDE